MLAGTTSPVVLTHTLSTTCPNGETMQMTYQAAAYPVSLDLGGGIGTSDAKRYLIGQQCIATLNTSGLTPTTCSWSVGGGDPFSGWTASQNGAVFTPLNTGTGSQMSCYFKKPDSATISCTAHLASPSGVLPTGGLDVSIDKQPKIEKPSAQLSVDIGMVEGWPVSAPNFVQLIRNESYAGSGNAAGIQWVGTIQTPFDYGEGGQWNWTQLITPQRKRMYNGSWEFIKSSTVTPPDVTGGEYLDGSYPYGTYWYSANGIPTGNADSPSEGLPADPLFTTVVVHDSFRDYLMYQPPGNDSVAVPLKRSKWFWQFGATQSNGAWNVSNTDAQWSFDGDFPDYPTWNGYLGGSSLYYNF